MTPTQPGLMEQMNDIRREVNNLKTSHPEESSRIQTALDDLLHAQILIENVLM